MRNLVWFAAWALVGALGCLALLGIATIGLFVLPLTLIAIVGLLTFTVSRQAWAAIPGALTGFGIPLLWVAYNSRGGGSCEAIPGGYECTSPPSPVPNGLTIGLVLVITGIVGGVALNIMARAIGSSRNASEENRSP